jgi:MFS family permease
MQNKESIYTLQFFLLCLSSVLFMGSFNMIIPELPNYLTSLGGAEYKGLIISLFTVTAGLSRPFSGKMADTVGRMPVMVVGVLVCIVIGVLYPVLNSILGFFLLRLIHGFSTGFKPTGTTAYLADIVPDKKRGEALGILGVSGSLGMASGPVLGSYIAAEYGTDIMFYSSSVVALLSILILAGMKETLEPKEKFSVETFKINFSDVYDPTVLGPSVVMLLTTFSFGTILTLVPDFSDYLGVSNRGMFFSFMLTSSIGIRLIAGRASDIYGRRNLLYFGTLILATGMAIVAFSETTFWFFTGAVVLGISVGINSPTVFAWTVDLADPKHRGRAMATMYIALEIGVGLGAFISGFIYNNNPAYFKYAFLVCSLLAVTAFFQLLATKPKYK